MNKEIYLNEKTGSWLVSSTEWVPNHDDLKPLTKVVHQRLSDMYYPQFPEQAQELGIIPKPVEDKPFMFGVDTAPRTRGDDPEE